MLRTLHWPAARSMTVAPPCTCCTNTGGLLRGILRSYTIVFVQPHTPGVVELVDELTHLYAKNTERLRYAGSIRAHGCSDSHFSTTQAHASALMAEKSTSTISLKKRKFPPTCVIFRLGPPMLSLVRSCSPARRRRVRFRRLQEAALQAPYWRDDQASIAAHHPWHRRRRRHQPTADCLPRRAYHHSVDRRAALLGYLTSRSATARSSPTRRRCPP